MYYKGRLFKSTIFLLGFVLVCLAFSWKVGTNWYYHNDGVTISCALEPAIKLIHPGDYSVKGCTYDHQPLYLLLVKGLSYFVGFKFSFYQYLNVIFFGLAWLFMALHLARKFHLSLAMSVPFFFLSSHSVLYRVQELRMYGLYLLSCCFLVPAMDELNEESKFNWKNAAGVLIGYFNFIFFLLPFSFYTLLKFKFSKLKDKGFIAFLGLLLVLMIIKIPYVFWWRVKFRSGGQPVTLSQIGEMFWQGPFVGSQVYFIVAWILVSLGLLAVLLPQLRSLKNTTYLIMIVASVIFVIVCAIPLEMHEMELRYLLYYIPIFSILSVQFLNRFVPAKLNLFLSLILGGLAFYNSTTMYVVGAGRSDEIRASGHAYGEVTDRAAEFWTDDEYFFFNYVGVYSYLETGRLVRPKAIDKNVTLPASSSERIFATALMTPEDHKKALELFPGKKTQLWEAPNFLGMYTIITSIAPSK